MLKISKDPRNFYLKLQIITGSIVVVSHWIVVLLNIWKPPEVLPTKALLYFGVPLVLLSLYFTSFKKIFSQRLGDAIQSCVLVLLISIFGFYYGGGIGGDFVFLFLFLIAFSTLLSDPFIPFFIGGLTSLIIIGESFIAINLARISYVPVIKTLLQVIAFLIVGWVSSDLVKRTLAEEKAKGELQKAYTELEEASKNIEELSRMKTEFLKVVNHQLRTPVTIIKGMLSMMVEGTVKGKELNEYIKKTYLSSERLTTILDDILLAQRLVGETEEMLIQPCQIEEITQRVVNHLKTQAEMKGLRILFKKPKSPIPVTLADEEKIERALSRLIDNAILYTAKGKIEVSLALRKKEEKAFIQISIKDQGIGLIKEDKKDLFKLFHRGERATHLHPNGSGLGLFIVKNLVVAHQGQIEAKSKGKDKGTTFIITLPVVSEI